MKKWGILILSGLVLAGVIAIFAFQPKPTTAQDLEVFYTSPINGGCYIAGPNQCKLHVDPFMINLHGADGSKLVEFALYANGHKIYDFRTDVSNPPSNDYYPSLVAMDFAATCGETYYMNLTARTDDYPNSLNAGQTAQFTCPANVP